MAQPTIEARLRRRFIVLTSDAALLIALRRALPAGWEMVHATALSDVGEFQDVLLNRFILLDLDENAVFDPVELIREVRVEMMLNTPIFCIGGDPDMREGARMARADRCFDRVEIAERVKQFCDQYGWGG
jgi:hypothetical protein